MFWRANRIWSLMRSRWIVIATARPECLPAQFRNRATIKSLKINRPHRLAPWSVLKLYWFSVLFFSFFFIYLSGQKGVFLCNKILFLCQWQPFVASFLRSVKTVVLSKHFCLFEHFGQTCQNQMVWFWGETSWRSFMQTVVHNSWDDKTNMLYISSLEKLTITKE